MKNERWNFWVNILDLSFITLGSALVSRETVMPLLVSRLTDSNIAIGAISSVFTLGLLLPQLFVANFSERLVRKKPFVMVLGGLGERLPFLLIGVAVWVFGRSRPGIALAAFFFFLAASAVCNGIATPAWFDMIAKVIRVERRGLFSGLSHSIGAGMAALSAAGVGLILGRMSFPHNFAILFALSFVAAAISWVGLALNREPDSPSIKPRVTHREYFRRLPSLLRSDRNYRRFLVFESLIHIGAMANGFFMVGAVRRFGVDSTWVGVYTGSLAATQALMYLVWGGIADRFGHKTVLVCGASALVVGNIVGFFAQSPFVYTVSFVGMGLFLAAEMVSRMNITLEFCKPEDRPTFIGITNTVVAPSVAIAPIIGGVIAGLLGYRGLIGLGAGVLFFAVAGMVFAVTDPRALPLRRDALYPREDG